MALNILALAMVVAITFMHSIFGFYSGLINVFCTVVSVIVAFGFYEAVTDWLTGTLGWSTAYVEPSALFGLFIVSMVALRTLADNYIRNNVVVPQWLNTAGAVVCGFINGQLITGMVLISALMLPLGGSVLGFERLSRVVGEKDPDHPEMVAVKRNSLWTRPDEMTVALFNWVSQGSLRGKVPFTTVYPNFTDTVFYTTNTVQPESTPAVIRDAKHDGFKNGITVQSAWIQEKPLEVRYREGVPTAKKPSPTYRRLDKPYQPAPGNKLIGVRLMLKPPSADRNKNAAIHLFRTTMIRLVGDTGAGPMQVYPRILMNADDKLGSDVYRLVDYDNNFSIRRSSHTMDVFFEVPEDFKPRFIEYRRHARAAVALSENAPKGELARLKTEEERRAERAAGRRTFGSVANTSGESDRLPFPMDRTALSRAGCEFEGDRLLRGRFSGETDRFKAKGGTNKIESMAVPDGMTMVQVQYSPKEAQSIVGDVFNFVGQLNQYFAIDDTAERYPMVGYYATTKRRGKNYIEFFLNGPADAPLDPGYKNMLDFKVLQRSEINNSADTTVTMLFYVRAGRTVVRVENQAHDGGDLRIGTRKPGGGG